mmetsp:Transcript_34259/g.62996  ORF Transcript_34259/g.62996 Transcript_34259/m.62996 type:complete len:88 (-) Transcript_34259:574-837(-)
MLGVWLKGDTLRRKTRLVFSAGGEGEDLEVIGRVVCAARSQEDTSGFGSEGNTIAESARLDKGRGHIIDRRSWGGQWRLDYGSDTRL